MENIDCVLVAETCDRNSLIEQAVSAIMELTDDERIRVLSKYVLKYNSSIKGE